MSKILFSTYPISSKVGTRRGRNHNGTDYAVPLNTEIQSVTGGTVIFTGYDADGYGNYIKIKDNSGNTHTYAHLNKIQTATGESVSPGEIIGLSGNTGRSTGPHLHYEVRDSHNTVLSGPGFIEGYNINQTFDVIGITDTEDEGDNMGLAAKIVTAVTIIILVGLAFVFLTKAFS